MLYSGFNFDFKAGKYGVKVWYDQYGWGDCTSFVTVMSQVVYTAGSIDASYNGGSVVVNGADISTDAMIKIGGYTGKVLQTFSTYSVFELPPLITT